MIAQHIAFFWTATGGVCLWAGLMFNREELIGASIGFSVTSLGAYLLGIY